MKPDRKVLVLFVLLLVIIAACAPAPTPAPTAAPPTAAPAATAAPTSAPAAATAPPAPTAVPAPAAINIGSALSLTGAFSAGGLQIRNGYELGVEAVNKNGGIDWGGGVKVPLKLTIIDDESDPAKMTQRMETLFNDNKVSVYLGGAGTPLNVAGAGVAEKNKTPFLGIAFAYYGAHQQGFKYLFSPFVKDPGLCQDFFKLTDTLTPKPTKIAIFAEKTDGGAEVAKFCGEEATKRNATMVVNDTYAPGATDYTALVTKARDGGAEVLIAFPTAPDGIAIVKQMKELGFNPKISWFIRAPDSPAWYAGLGKDGDYMILSPGWHPAVKFPGAAELNTAHQAKYNGPALATTGPAYAVIQILADALSRAKSTDREKIRDAIAATNMTTVEGPVKFNPDGTAPMVVIFDQWQAGKQELIWPADHQTKPLAYPAVPFSSR